MMQWGEVYDRHCDVLLGYYWHSDGVSEGGQSASWLWLTVGTERGESEPVDKEGDYWNLQGNHQENNLKNMVKETSRELKLVH